MNPKAISERDVRITDINVRSALMRVRWNDIPVRREASSVAMRLDSDDAVTRGCETSWITRPAQLVCG